MTTGLAARFKHRVYTALPGAVAEGIGTSLRFANPRWRRRMRRDAARCESVQDWLAFGREYLNPGANQQDSEAIQFFTYAAAQRPRRVCEIGTLYGGNFLVMSRVWPVEQLIGIDLRVRYRSRLRRVLPEGLRASLLNGSTTDPRTLAAVEQLLGGEPLDLLFIDGDHSFEGVRSDFLTYRHLVRPGGLIAFHDIQPDGRDQRGDFGAYAGGVPVMWRLVRDRYPSVEFVADPEGQFGYGIGVITYSPEVEVSETELTAA